MLPEIILNSPLFGIGLNVICYTLSELLIERLSLRVLPPFLPACALIIVTLLYAPNVEYKHYAAGAEFINFLLGPATIALALPLYKNHKIIMEKSTAILGGTLIATMVAIIVVYCAAKGLGASERVLLSLIPKSVTTPIAIDISKTLGGIPALTTAAVIFTGMLGATFNHRLLKLFGIKNDIAAGLAIGASSHGLGTSACASVSPVQLAIGGVAIALTGIATSILAPILLPLLQALL
jgi:predicted murein hydrolase (TIGR00659 family)